MNNHIKALFDELLKGCAEILRSFKHTDFEVEVVPIRYEIDLTQANVNAIFTLASFPVWKIWRLENGYWPEAYIEDRLKSPWWLVKTDIGLIEIGWRKRVLQISWNDTKVRGLVTQDDVTKSDDMVHASSIDKAVEYVLALRKLSIERAING